MDDSRWGSQCQYRVDVPCMVVAKLLLIGEDLHQNQWWVEFDADIVALYAKVKEEREDEKYVQALRDAVKAILAHYAPPAVEDGSGEAGPEQETGEAVMDDWHTHDR